MQVFKLTHSNNKSLIFKYLMHFSDLGLNFNEPIQCGDNGALVTISQSGAQKDSATCADLMFLGNADDSSTTDSHTLIWNFADVNLAPNEVTTLDIPAGFVKDLSAAENDGDAASVTFTTLEAGAAESLEVLSCNYDAIGDSDSFSMVLSQQISDSSPVTLTLVSDASELSLTASIAANKGILTLSDLDLVDGKEYNVVLAAGAVSTASIVSSGPSSDYTCSFTAGADMRPPRVDLAQVNPAPGSSVAAKNSVRLVFNEPVECNMHTTARFGFSSNDPINDIQCDDARVTIQDNVVVFALGAGVEWPNVAGGISVTMGAGWLKDAAGNPSNALEVGDYTFSYDDTAADRR